MATNTDHWVDPYALSNVYLDAMGAPNTPENRRVMVAWMLAESPSKTVNGKRLVNARGWNALNWTTPAMSKRATGSWAGLYGHVFSTYDSPQAAAADLNDLLSANDSRNFSTIKSSFVSGGNTISAINDSAWVNGVGKKSYFSKGINKLLEIYNGLGGTDTKAVSADIPTTDNTAATILGLSTDTVFTQDMLNSLVDKLSTLTGEKKDDLFSIYVDYLGKPVGSIPVNISDPNAVVTGTPRSPDPITAVTGGVEGAINNLTKSIAPALSIVLGVVLMLGGLFILYKASSNEGSASVPTPFSIVKAAA